MPNDQCCDGGLEVHLGHCVMKYAVLPIPCFAGTSFRPTGTGFDFVNRGKADCHAKDARDDGIDRAGLQTAHAD